MYEEIINKLRVEKNRQAKKLKAKEVEIDKLNCYLVTQRHDIVNVRAKVQRLEQQNDDLSSSLDMWLKINKINIFIITVGTCFAYYTLKQQKTVLPELPPKKLSLIENFFLCFTDVENE